MYVIVVNLIGNSIWLFLAPVEDLQKAYERREHAVYVPVDDEKAMKIRDLLIEKRRKCYVYNSGQP